MYSRSLAWKQADLAAAWELREAIVGVIVRKAEEYKELEAFSYSVAHDLRAPFRHIFGYCGMLQKRAPAALDQTSRRYLKTISESAHQGEALVDSLLAFSQMTRTTLRSTRIDFSRLVAELRADLQGESADREVEWRIEPLPEITGDEVLLRVAMRNLLSNALKYTRRRDTAVIEVGSRNEGNEQVIFVRDNGVGFDMRYAHKLFGVFQRLHATEQFEGIGIGLANVRRTIERHGGRIWAESQPDAGATFFFALPNQAREESIES